MKVLSPSQTEIYPKASLLVLPSLGKLIPANSRGVLPDQNQQELQLGALNPKGHVHGLPSVLRQSPAEDHGGFSDSGPSVKAEMLSTAALRHDPMKGWRSKGGNSKVQKTCLQIQRGLLPAPPNCLWHYTEPWSHSWISCYGFCWKRA